VKDDPFANFIIAPVSTVGTWLWRVPNISNTDDRHCERSGSLLPCGANQFYRKVLIKSTCKIVSSGCRCCRISNFLAMTGHVLDGKQQTKEWFGCNNIQTAFHFFYSSRSFSCLSLDTAVNRRALLRCARLPTQIKAASQFYFAWICRSFHCQ
jgi:hypothetical protein